LRESVFKAVIHAYDTTLKTTISIGIAVFPQDAETSEELIDKADWAMYRSKKNGRNQVTAFGSYKE
jgi:diguanylate cyclase (GGDEF)-like protein